MFRQCERWRGPVEEDLVTGMSRQRGVAGRSILGLVLCHRSTALPSTADQACEGSSVFL